MAMRLAKSKSLLLWAVAVLMVGAVPGCNNPFDPLNKSDKIQGLTYFDFSASQEHWDSDPEWDGVQITMNYKNEFGDTLDFHDKPHQVEIEIWSQVDSDDATPVKVLGSLLVTKTVEFSNSDDLIRIPIEYYSGYLALPSTVAISGYLRVRIFPPQEYPRTEIISPFQVVDLYTPEDVPVTTTTTP